MKPWKWYAYSNIQERFLTEVYDEIKAANSATAWKVIELISNSIKCMIEQHVIDMPEVINGQIELMPPFLS